MSEDVFVPHEFPWYPVVQSFPTADKAKGLVLTKAEVIAIKSLEAGVANDHQQKLALKAIVDKVCGVRDMSFRPGGEDGRRATDFAEGKRFVGEQLTRALRLPMEVSGDTNARTTDSSSTRRPAPRPRRNPAKPRDAAAETA